MKTAEPTETTALLTRIGERLGVARIQSDAQLAMLVEKRLPATALKALARHGLSDLEVYELIVPRRTLAHRIARQEPLSRDQSDRAVRIARITAYAEEVFGEPQRAWRWLRKPKRRFNSRTPNGNVGHRGRRPPR